MKIAIFGHKVIPASDGGVEVVVENLACRLAQKGHSVTCYNRSGQSEEQMRAEAPRRIGDVRLKNVFTVNRKGLAAVSAAFSATVRASFGRYDVVHIHAEGPAFMCWLPRLCGKRVVVTIHGLDHQRAKWGGLARRFILMGEKNAARFAHEVIVLSRQAQNYFRETYGRETVYLPNGVTIHPSLPGTEIGREWGLKKDGYVLFLGRLVPEKGLRALIEAFRQVKTDKQLVIAGSSSDTDDFVREIRKKAAGDERIRFVGSVHGRKKSELYSNAYFYTLPSDLEGMPLTLLEAMSYGNCCLISDIPECAEVAGDCAAMFHRGSGEELLDEMQTLFDHPEEVEKYRAQAAAQIRKGYDWDRVAEETLKLYK